MMARVERAAALFKEGFSCSQAVFAAFAEHGGLTRAQALRIAQPFGGGLSHRGELCGAVAGGLLAIGLKHGRTRAEDLAARDRTYAIVNAFMDRFRSLHGELSCPGLLGLQIGTPEGLAEARARRLFETRCAGYVESAAALVEELL
ncbi:MAG: C_GCAxxG_C_C family protein [Candidatus Aminicenantes bacterium]|nr:C_GCAxxG_C_C family protein [Candidatus Aminicenantes bacterium]